MVKVKTFTSADCRSSFHNKLTILDVEVNDFLQKNNIKKIVSISDCTTSNNGDTMGIFRVVAYEE